MTRVKGLEALVNELDREAVKGGFEYGVKLTIARFCAWSCEVRITPNSTIDGSPDRSLVSFSVGGGSAREVAENAIEDALCSVAEGKLKALEATRDLLRRDVEIATLRAKLRAPVLS